MKNNRVHTPLIKHFGLIDYETTYEAMHDFTQNRDEKTPDEIWVLEHPQIFTQGRAGKAEHILKKCSIPIFQSDRGGQVTFHGPGQIIIYPLINLKRHNLNIRQFVTLLEDSVIHTLDKLSINAYARKDAPGVYVKTYRNGLNIKQDNLATINDLGTSKEDFNQIIEKKICSLGLKVSRGCTLHGLALNIDIDLEPFDFINPCGLLGMQMTSIAQILANKPNKQEITSTLVKTLLNLLDKPVQE